MKEMKYVFKPVFENFTPFKKKQIIINNADRAFTRTHCVTNIMHSFFGKCLL